MKTRQMTAKQIGQAGLVIVGEFGLPPTAGWIVCRPESREAVQQWYDDYPEGDLDPTRLDDLREIGGEYVIEAE